MSAILKTDYKIHHDVDLIIVAILLDHGADVHGKNRRGQTPKQCAEEYRDEAANVVNYNAVIALLVNAMRFQITGHPVEHAEAECSICLEDDLSDFCQLPCCSQRFHVHCISHWYEYSDTKLCPLCRGGLTNAAPVVRNVC